jgi:hypothetical protein
MNKGDAILLLDLRPEMTVSQLVDALMTDFERTKLTAAEFEIPGTDGVNQFVLHFEISLRPIKTTH